MQEDRIYQLQCMLEECQASREAAARENAALKQQLETGDRGAGPDSVPADIRGPSLDTPEPSRGARPRTRAEVPKLEVPSIELPEASDSPPVETTPNPPSSSIRRVQPTQIVINKKLTGGLDRDGRNGDDGLLVVVEPRDAAGNLVDAA
ncbi:MAG TPA: hypothetical protein VHV08_05905, partial [Pirellulales bacterium]|nr:hypothetical protein [Pirellulales bacterium]